MASIAAGLVDEVFQVTPDLIPKSNEETYKRLHYYVAEMSVSISDHLRDALIELRKMSDQLPNQELQQLALKGYTDEEFVAAVKELLCIWLHLEAMDQGGEEMPGWLLAFFHLALGAADYMIAKPKAREVMRCYENCDDLAALCLQCCERTCQALGFGDASMIFGPTIYPVLLYTGQLRQKFLERALTSPISQISVKAA